MEYVIALVGMSAVFAAWDGFRRSLLSASDKKELKAGLADMAEKLRQFEVAHLAQKNHLAELKSFINSQRKSR